MKQDGASLVAYGEESACQCRRQVQSLSREDLTCPRAAEPIHHNYWACAP